MVNCEADGAVIIYTLTFWDVTLSQLVWKHHAPLMHWSVQHHIPESLNLKNIMLSLHVEFRTIMFSVSH